MSGDGSAPGIILEPTDRPSPGLALGLGIQLTAVGLVATITLTTVVYRAAGQSDVNLAWAVFAAIAVSGLTTRHCSRCAGVVWARATSC
ncbi:MAG: hypothetical protein OXI38_09275 [Bacteroidota bacterium]|nr:hypothetical protein [Bacteroidota bacterium]